MTRWQWISRGIWAVLWLGVLSLAVWHGSCHSAPPAMPPLPPIPGPGPNPPPPVPVPPLPTPPAPMPPAPDPGPLAVPTVNLPATLQASPGRLTLVQATSNGRVLRWVCLDDAVDLLPYLNNSAIFSTAVPGSYRVLAYTALADQPSLPAVCTVVVAGPAPLPPGPVPPGPGPGPTPPGPVPPAPAPTDPLYALLLPAWQGEQDAGRAAQKASLAAVYRGMVKDTADPALTTVGALYERLVADRRTTVADSQLIRLRQALGAQTAALLPTNPAQPLDGATRAAAAALFNRIAAVLDQLP